MVMFCHSILDTWLIGTSASNSLLVYALDSIGLDAMFCIYFVLNANQIKLVSLSIRVLINIL